MPKPNCENLSNSASAKPSYFFLFFLLFIFFFIFSSSYTPSDSFNAMVVQFFCLQIIVHKLKSSFLNIHSPFNFF